MINRCWWLSLAGGRRSGAFTLSPIRIGRVEELSVMQRIDGSDRLEMDRAMRITLEWALRNRCRRWPDRPSEGDCRRVVTELDSGAFRGP
jgi:hypothetical protein